MQKTVLITGSSSGFGRLSVLEFQRQGWNVMATMRSPHLEEELQQLERVLVTRLDVTDRESIRLAIAAGIGHFGQIDVVVNNAGFGAFGLFEEASQDEIAHQLDVNLGGIIAVSQLILPHFRANGSGMLINISSVAGRVAAPYSSLYHTTKFAVEGLSESLQHELAPFGVLVKLIEPGYFKTNFDQSVQFNSGARVGELSSYSNQVRRLMEATFQNLPAGDPQRVARKIVRVANSRSHKLRYAVGSDVQAFLFLKRLLPTAIMRFMIRRSFKPSGPTPSFS